MDDIQVVDNFLDEKYFKGLQELIFSPNFLWSRVYDAYNRDGFQFVHLVHHSQLTFLHTPALPPDKFEEDRSIWFQHFLQCVKDLNIISLIKIKVNLLSRTKERVIHGWHTDIALPEVFSNIKNAKTSILYMNTNNGVTIFEDTKEEIKSVANRMVTFSSVRSHAGTTHTDKDIQDRCVINFNYF